MVTFMMQMFELACKDASPGEEEEEEDPNVNLSSPKRESLCPKCQLSINGRHS
jgi:hypothetical protein